ncbi:hypothetical protein G5I_00758 [Acromyrmex echinatior]|uniref:Uncharacterized protein n=1 Tax=Acromyrmex echinatior TaxID=103372 RepID=F4W5Q9_ACREC|nr:hypothetical protein G5I_00758 [Acromyrmex echinatior]
MEAEVKTRRRCIKTSATRLRTYLESPQAEQATKFELVEHSDSNDQNVIAAHAEERARFEEAYFQLMASYEQRINQFESAGYSPIGQ